MNMIHINVEGNQPQTLNAGTIVSDLMPSTCSSEGRPYVAAIVNNDLVSLTYPLTVNGSVSFITAASSLGWRVYRRSLCFLMAKAINDICPEAVFSIEHSIGTGLFCNFAIGDSAGIDQALLKRIQTHMAKLVERNIPIERKKVSFTDAFAMFEACGATEKLNLLRYRNPPRVVVHDCEGFCDLAHSPLVPETGLLKHFALIPYPPGFILQIPDRSNPQVIPPFEDQPHLFQIFQEHKRWGRILEVTTVGTLNRLTYEDKVEDFINTAEALHEKKLGKIADQIAARESMVKVILVAGPSCAGKTTFSKRLSTHLRVNGLQPVVISTDDYFVGKEHNPVDEEGNPDYEHIEAVDIPAFNQDLLALIEGRSIPIRRFNFETRTPEISKDKLQLHSHNIIIIEGIHGLNPRLTELVPADRKFKIYVSALTQLKIDSENRISTTDNRLIRRMVRDHQYRGHSALDTLRMWPMVRRGEKQWIFPYQKEADATFNSALDFELGVLKSFVEPLLMRIKPSDPEYAESRRLTGFLLNFLPIPDAYVPPSSILREYIGGSALDY